MKIKYNMLRLHLNVVAAFRSIAIVSGFLLIVLSMVAVSLESKAQITTGATWGQIVEKYPNGDFQKIGSLKGKYRLEGYNHDGDITYYFDKNGRSNKVVWKIYEKTYESMLIDFYNGSSLRIINSHKWLIEGTLHNMYVIYNKRKNTFTFYKSYLE